MHIASHISRALCLIKHNSTKFVFMFLILSRHLCLGPSQNYALKTIMSIICFKKSPAAPFVNSFVIETFANLQLATVISICLSIYPVQMEQLGSGRTQFREIL